MSVRPARADLLHQLKCLEAFGCVVVIIYLAAPGYDFNMIYQLAQAE